MRRFSSSPHVRLSNDVDAPGMDRRPEPNPTLNNSVVDLVAHPVLSHHSRNDGRITMRPPTGTCSTPSHPVQVCLFVRASRIGRVGGVMGSVEQLVETGPSPEDLYGQHAKALVGLARRSSAPLTPRTSSLPLPLGSCVRPPCVQLTTNGHTPTPTPLFSTPRVHT